jgi:hypothetical protein
MVSLNHILYYKFICPKTFSLFLGTIIVNIMTPQLRNFYKLERRWKNAEVYDLVSITGNKFINESDGSLTSFRIDDDPFWS